MINSTSNEKIKKYSKLLQKKYRDETNLYLVSTDHLVREAIKQRNVIDIFLLENKENCYGNVTIVTETVMRKLTNLKTLPNVLAVVKKKETRNINGNVILLDSVQDPGNVGTIIRSAVAFNIDTIVLGDGTVDIYNEKVLRASEGMINNINIIKRNLIDTIMDLKIKNYEIIGTKVDGGTNIKDININNKYALVIGNEGRGMSSTISDLCDKYLYIKMNNEVESLNAAVAASILLYEMDDKYDIN